jgi:L-fucose isomerase-like protein
MMSSLKAKILSHPDVSIEQKHLSERKLREKFPEMQFTFADDEPDLFYFTTGGSEHFAVKYLRKERLNLLAAFQQENAFASAVEVMAYARMKNLPARLFCLDDRDDWNAFTGFLKISLALKRMANTRAGLIGESSPWLVASGVAPETLKMKLGIELINISWEELGDFRRLQPDKGFQIKYGVNDHPGLEDASKINRLLSMAVRKYHLDAIAVECFPLVQQQHVTACLSLSDLNDKGIVASCEGDLVSMAGMMLSKAITGKIPWMANVASISGKNLLLAHCTAPANVLSGFEIDTHFETGKGTAVKGSYASDEVTIFRLGNHIKDIFLTRGRIISRPNHPFACRTQIEVELPEEAIRSIKDQPLGNHHLVMPGDHTIALRIAGETMMVDQMITSK